MRSVTVPMMGKYGRLRKHMLPTQSAMTPDSREDEDTIQFGEGLA